MLGRRKAKESTGVRIGYGPFQTENLENQRRRTNIQARNKRFQNHPPSMARQIPTERIRSHKRMCSRATISPKVSGQCFSKRVPAAIAPKVKYRRKAPHVAPRQRTRVGLALESECSSYRQRRLRPTMKVNGSTI